MAWLVVHLPKGFIIQKISNPEEHFTFERSPL